MKTLLIILILSTPIKVKRSNKCAKFKAGAELGIKKFTK